jgi:hypothetical protein
MSVVEAKIQTIEDHVPADLDGDSEQATDHLSTKISLGCFARIGSAAIGWGSFASSVINAAARARAVWGRLVRRRIGVALFSRKLRRVELVSACWKSAPNHSRPATCVVEADIDAED